MYSGEDHIFIGKHFMYIHACTCTCICDCVDHVTSYVRQAGQLDESNHRFLAWQLCGGTHAVHGMVELVVGNLCDKRKAFMMWCYITAMFDAHGAPLA